MHPPLATHKHQACQEAIEALDNCHNANSFNKFLGLCNEAKKNLDKCLDEAFLASRAGKKEQSAAKRKRIEQIWKDMEEPPTMPSTKSA